MKYRIFAMTLSLATTALIGCAQSHKPQTTPPVPATKAAPAPNVKKSQEPAPISILCRYEDIQRELKVVYLTDRCRVDYIKDGSLQEIATGALGSTYCAEVVERVKNNLVAAGYKCQ